MCVFWLFWCTPSFANTDEMVPDPMLAPTVEMATFPYVGDTTTVAMLGTARAETTGGRLTLPRVPAPASALKLLAGSLFFIFVGGVATWWGSHRRKQKFLPKESIAVLASQALGPKNRLVLVAAGKRTLLLCVGDKGTRVLARWHKEAEAEAPVEATQQVNAAEMQQDVNRKSWKEILEEEERFAEVPRADVTATANADNPWVAGLLAMRRKTVASPRTMRGAYGV